jgi:hypothetical protein
MFLMCIFFSEKKFKLYEDWYDPINFTITKTTGL